MITSFLSKGSGLICFRDFLKFVNNLVFSQWVMKSHSQATSKIFLHVNFVRLTLNLKSKATE